MKYQLNTTKGQGNGESLLDSIKKLIPLMHGERKYLLMTLIAVIFTSAATLCAPVIITHTIDTYIQSKNYHGIIVNSIILLFVYIVGGIANYFQTLIMGGVGRRTLFTLRNSIFMKLQELPVAFFSQNKTGDLISRINNDTDKLNMFFAQSLTQFLGNFFLIAGSGLSILLLNFRLGIAALFPAIIILIITQIISPWVKRKNFISLQSTGSMSSEIQESLSHFKVIIAFNRLDYFKKKFEEYNKANYHASMQAGVASNIFTPLYTLVSNMAQLIVLTYGIYMITHGSITIGLLIGFQLYVTNFYSPLRQFASVWSSFQLALASLDRVSEVLSLQSDMKSIKDKAYHETDDMLQFLGVSFEYPDGKKVLKNVNISLKKGKTYALVGPTGGGKTTTATLMARLYDPTSGEILLDGKDIRSYDSSLRAKKIGFILQEPFLFTGTVKENIIYGNDEYLNHTDSEIYELLRKKGMDDMISKFDKGLDTLVSASGESISLGQKQLLAFMRAILKNPDLLILDEATANIDTLTEKILEEMLEKLPKYTTKVIIAHRLNTIKNADEIFFVNSGEVVSTGSMENAMKMLLNGKRES